VTTKKLHTVHATFRILLAVSLLSACGRETKIASSTPLVAKRVDVVTVRFPIPVIEAGQTPFYVANDQGYYRDEGLDVRFGMGSKELNPVKTVVSGTDMIGILGGPDTLLVARSAGQPVKAVAVLHRNSNFPVILTLESSGLTKLHDLQGKRIGFFYGHISTDVLRAVLRKEGIKYKESDVGFNYAPLITHQVDGEWAFRVTAGLDLPAKGVAVNVINPADYGVTSHGYTIFATDETVRAKADVIARFLRATFKGVDYTVKHPNEANGALLKRDKSLDAQLSRKRLLLYNEVTSDSSQFPPGYFDESMFATTYMRLDAEKVLAKPFDVHDAYTQEFLRQLYPQNVFSATPTNGK
jgi:ABC-type nitrate/sulfonate/bicarbonate transport system substrate-binding protein